MEQTQVLTEEKLADLLARAKNPCGTCRHEQVRYKSAGVGDPCCYCHYAHKNEMGHHWQSKVIK